MRSKPCTRSFTAFGLIWLAVVGCNSNQQSSDATGQTSERNALVIDPVVEPDDAFSAYVDAEGTISLPKDFRTRFSFLGSWFVPEGDASGFHDVFADAATINAYRAKGEFRDGAVLVKELRGSNSGDYTTGQGVHSASSSIKQWFVMIRDRHQRFKDHPNWGEGWGWALFKTDNPEQNVSTDFRTDCLQCHVPAKDNDWVYIEAYPTLGTATDQPSDREAISSGGEMGEDSMEEDPGVGDIDRGMIAFRNCAACHQAGPRAKNDFGPVLSGVVDRAAGSYPGYPYSESLKKAGAGGLRWTEERLFQWLGDPPHFIQSQLNDPGATTKMPVKFSSPQLRRDVIAYLKEAAAEQDADPGHHHAMAEERANLGPAIGVASDETPDPTAGMVRVQQTLVAPPHLPDHEQTVAGPPRVVQATLRVEEKRMVVDSVGTEIMALTYNGSIPGPIIVAHEDDYVELTLVNPASNRMEHNIDLHAITGFHGGAELTTVQPGQEATVRFQADRAGVFLYHCAPGGSMIPYHVTHGMSGAMLVLPRNGIDDGAGNSLVYDRAYYIGECDYYVPRDADGNFKSYSAHGEDFAEWMDVARTSSPTHVVFNGKAGSLVGETALRANVGENVLFIHSQANRDTRPHLIGGHGDYVWETGTFSSPPQRDVQTWFVRGGGVGAAMYRFKQPGLYVYLNHNLIEAVELGAAAHVVVGGDWNSDLTAQLYHGDVRESASAAP